MIAKFIINNEPSSEESQDCDVADVNEAIVIARRLMKQSISIMSVRVAVNGETITLEKPQ